MRKESDPLRGEFLNAVRGLGGLYGKNVTVAQRRQLITAPVSKTLLLTKLESWFSPKRPKVTWAQVLHKHWALIVNSGVSMSGLSANDDVSACLSAMLMYALRATIKSECDGWQGQGRAVSVYASELSLLAGTSPDIITWMRNTGRGFGVRLVLATQYPDQLDPQLKQALMTFGTVFWYRQVDSKTIAEAAENLSTDGGDWSGADIATLEPYHAILRATVGKRVQPAVPVRMSYWDTNRARFIADQGYPARPLPGPGVGPAGLDLGEGMSRWLHL